MKTKVNNVAIINSAIIDIGEISRRLVQVTNVTAYLGENIGPQWLAITGALKSMQGTLFELLEKAQGERK